MVFTDDAERRARRPSSSTSPEAERRAALASPTTRSSELARHALTIEEHYGRPMDIEWGKDGVDGKLYILQARPETVKSRGSTATPMQRYRLQRARRRARRGPRDRPEDRRRRRCACVARRRRRWTRVQAGDVLVTDMTDPDWEPVMKRAAAIVTNRGGRTCHAAIIARELGIPAVVGCGDATATLTDGAQVTVSLRRGRHRLRLRRPARRSRSPRSSSTRCRAIAASRS